MYHRKPLLTLKQVQKSKSKERYLKIYPLKDPKIENK